MTNHFPAEIKIEKDVPLPVHRGRYPFAPMEVGDSFFVANTNASVLSNASVHYSQKLGHKYTAKTITENGTIGARVWRIK